MTSTPSQRRWLSLASTTLAAALSVWLLLATLTTAGEIPLISDDGDQPPDSQVLALQEIVAVDVVAETRSTAAPTEPTPSPTAIAAPPPPFPSPFEPAPNEAQADAKKMGAAVAYRLTNYWPDSSPTELATGVTVDSARVDALIAAAEPVHHPGMWSRGTIEYAQLGGHLNGGISIMVVVRQELGTEGVEEYDRAETRTMDVRLVRNRYGAWTFDELASAGGEPEDRPADLSPLAASVVDDPRIDLPDSALWDIYSGHTDPALLQVMADIAERTPYAVVVLHTGHPDNVFGTDRVSNHTVGRAVDIHELDSARVIDSHDIASSTYALAEWLASRPDIKELGSPWLIEDAIAHTFTNEVHHDHLHIGVFPEA